LSRVWRRVRYKKPRKARPPGKVNLEELARAISWLDEYRKFRCVDPAILEKAVDDSGVRKAKEVWKKVRTDISKIAFVPMANKSLVKWMKVLPPLKHFAYLSVAALAALLVAAHSFNFVKDILIRYFWWLNLGILLIAAVIFTNVVLYADYYVRSKIRGMYKVYGSRYKRARARIKWAVQELINCLREQIKRRGEDPGEYKIRMLHVDYEGIKVVKKPGYISEYYRVVPVLKGEGGGGGEEGR